jgi:hypothetical protein
MGIGHSSQGVKRPGPEADHSPPYIAKDKNTGSYISTPQYVSMAWCLTKHKDNFTYTFTISQYRDYARGWTTGVRFPGGEDSFVSPTRPDQLWGPPNPLPNEYWWLLPRR